MIKLKAYINEAWSGVKKQASIDIDAIEAWCDEMDIENYTINPKGEIDVDGGVNLDNKDFEELPYKFGKVIGSFDIGSNPNLTSLKNCPEFVGDYFSCSQCSNLDSLEGCPKEVEWSFYCYNCKRKFTTKEVKNLCNVKGKISIWKN